MNNVKFDSGKHFEIHNSAYIIKLLNKHKEPNVLDLCTGE